MRTYKLTIAYDGSRYQGWQRQSNTDKTVQGLLEQAASETAGYPLEVQGSGRTDGGVHAKGQTASVILRGKVQESEFLQNMNRLLPLDIRVIEMELVKNGFHARLSAVGKCYEYWIDMREKPDVFMRKYTYHYPKELNIEAMQRAADDLIGRYDFAAFTDKKRGKVHNSHNLCYNRGGTGGQVEDRIPGQRFYVSYGEDPDRNSVGSRRRKKDAGIGEGCTGRQR